MDEKQLEILKTDYPPLKITKEVVKENKGKSKFTRHIKTFRGDVYTDEEFNKRSDKVLERELP